MGMQLELNWFIVAKNKEDIIPSIRFSENLNEQEQELYLAKSGLRIYPIGSEFTLPVIAGGECLGLASVTHIELNENETIVYFKPVHMFEPSDHIAAYYEQSYKDYKGQQEVIDDGGRLDLTPKFIERLHGQQ